MVTVNLTVNSPAHISSRYNQMTMSSKGALYGEVGHERTDWGKGPPLFVLLTPEGLWIDHAHLSLEYFPGPVGHLS